MRWTKSGASLSCALALVTLAATGGAQAPSKDNADCPPGAFCEEASLEPPAQPAPPPKETEQEGMSEPTEEPPKATEPASKPHEPRRSKTHTHPHKKRKSRRATKAKAAQGPITVVIPSTEKPRVYVIKTDPNGGPPSVTQYEAGHEPGAASKTEPPADEAKVDMRRRRRHRRWGLNMHATGMFLPGHDLADIEPGMAGAGLSFRYRPVPVFALDFGLDILVGTDGNGFERREVPLSVSGVLYPFKGFLQPYVSVGLNTAFARVESLEHTEHLVQGTEGQYNYVGVHAGLGLELRITRLIGLNIEGAGILRKRVDSDAKAHPEFVDIDTGETSNTSTGGILRAGLSFWW